ncbi:MAG: hypothetical protein KGY75_05205 [Candidatus Cloacimonetes bacterium]|nr:hypothetical protein [Candidatus Cloacimonadota bacterium]MBS3767498.1 hypothetical protein [Candidatus Cloacimonadota bacterium]
MKQLADKYGFDPKKVKTLVCGKKYSAVMLQNGQIGVCANLFRKFDFNKNDLFNIDFDNIVHRIFINAYFTATLNYRNRKLGSADIFEAIDFHKFSNIVMVGLFRPILNKMQSRGLEVATFDKKQIDRRLLPMQEMKKCISSADSIILTATSIFNKTFYNIVNKTKEGCKIFILGPSSTMSPEILNYKNVEMIFGAVFPLFDEKVLEVIAKGGGTRKFLKLGNKVFISR